jgi:hypothetical protein
MKRRQFIALTRSRPALVGGPIGAAAAVCLFLTCIGSISATERLQTPVVKADQSAWNTLPPSPAQDDTPLAEIVSGEFHVLGTSETLSCIDGLSWIRRIAEAGNAEAMFELGEFYDRGSCVPANERKSAAWLLKAAQIGHAGASGALGKLYVSGAEGIAPNYKNALRWLSRGVIELDPQSFYYLGLMYEHGMGVRLDDGEAYELFDISAHLYPLFDDGRVAAVGARDRVRERLMPLEVSNTAIASKHLLLALLEHDEQNARSLLPTEVLTALPAPAR